MQQSELVRLNKEFTLASWTAQKNWDPLTMVHAEGVYFWDAAGTRFLDWSSQTFNVNIGHRHPAVIQAICEQAARLTFAGPSVATEPRARLGEMLAQITPGRLPKSFLTLGGADAVENAMKMARLYTGRQKILARYRSYHGATFGAMSAGGDPRRLANEPGVPWIIRMHDPYAYRSPLYEGRSSEEGDQALIDLVEETIQVEDPESIAAILLEGYSGASGVIQGGEVFWQGIVELCDRYGLLLIVDEVLSGFGRTGRWFGVDHYPGVRPDLVCMAKGLTSGYVPLGAVSVSREIADYFEDHTFWGGLTYSGHALGCAAAIANIEVIQQEHLVERAQTMGAHLRAGLEDLASKHPCVGDIRGAGLHQVLELVTSTATRKPMSPFNQPLSDAMRRVAQTLRTQGLNAAVRWNWVFSTPPLIIDEAQIDEGIQILDRALTEADRFVID